MKFRPRFSLRALLVFVAIVCVACGFVANQRRIISDRQAFIEKVWPNDGFGTTQKEVSEVVSTNNEIPIIRSILGDEAYYCISIDASGPQSLIEEARWLFPEATIFRVSGQEAEQIYPKENSQN